VKTARPATPRRPGTTVANVAQQAYLPTSPPRSVLPMFKARNKPFVLVFWSRDPDGSQHNTGDSLNTDHCPASTGRPRWPASRTPTTTSPSSARRSTSSGLAASTNIIVSADHGFSTISRKARPALGQGQLRRHAEGFLPMGFLALDLAKALTCRCSTPTTRMRP
jgi:hypothetical protein